MSNRVDDVMSRNPDTLNRKAFRRQSSWRISAWFVRFLSVLILGLGCGTYLQSLAVEALPPLSSFYSPPPPLIADQNIPFLETPQHDLPQSHMRIGKHVYLLELATTPEQSEKGLMFRTELAQGHGMAFIFKPARVVYFWMKNTYIPLDIIFLEHGRVVHVARQVQPCQIKDCPVISSTLPTDMVVELPAGSAKKHGLKIGVSAEFILLQKDWKAKSMLTDAFPVIGN